MGPGILVNQSSRTQPLEQPVGPLIEALGGAAEVGRGFRVTRRSVARYLIGETPLRVTYALRDEARRRGFVEIEDYLAARLVEQERRGETNRYLANAKLFAISGKWHMRSGERRTLYRRLLKAPKRY